jgi:hypothetical protein
MNEVALKVLGWMEGRLRQKLKRRSKFEISGILKTDRRRWVTNAYDSAIDFPNVRRDGVVK